MDFLEDGRSPIERKIYWDLWNKFSLVLYYTLLLLGECIESTQLKWLLQLMLNTFFCLPVSWKKSVFSSKKDTQKNCNTCAHQIQHPSLSPPHYSFHTLKNQTFSLDRFWSDNKKSSRALQFFANSLFMCQDENQDEDEKQSFGSFWNLCTTNHSFNVF